LERGSASRSNSRFAGGQDYLGSYVLLQPLRVTDPRSVGRPNVGGMSSCAVVWVLIEFFMFICPYQTRAL
jgi:hypothetical protein